MSVKSTTLQRMATRLEAESPAPQARQRILDTAYELFSRRGVRGVEINGWVSSHRQTEAGAVESEQRVTLDRAAVKFDELGARALGRRYWAEVRRSTFGLVQPGERDCALELRAFGRRPLLLSFGRPVLEVSPFLIRCSYPIIGRLLARKP